MLAGTGLGHDALLAEALGDDGLAERVVDLVGAGVGKVFALEPDARTADVFGQTLGEVERGGAAHEVAGQQRQLGVEGRIGEGLVHAGLELVKGGHHGLGHEAPAKLAPAAHLVGRIRVGGGSVLGGVGAAHAVVPSRAAAINAETRS